MSFKSIYDLLSFAITKEQDSVRFYKSLAGHVKSNETAVIFATMARQEQRHIEALRLELMKLGYTVDAESASQQDSVDEAADDSTLQIDKQIGKMSYVEALRFGIQKEQAAFALYAEMMALAEDLDMQKVLLELAKEEMRHLIQLEHDIEILTGHRER